MRARCAFEIGKGLRILSRLNGAVAEIHSRINIAKSMLEAEHSSRLDQSPSGRWQRDLAAYQDAPLDLDSDPRSVIELATSRALRDDFPPSLLNYLLPSSRRKFAVRHKVRSGFSTIS